MGKSLVSNPLPKRLKRPEGILGHEAGAIVESIGEGVTSGPADAKMWLGLNF